MLSYAFKTKFASTFAVNLLESCHVVNLQNIDESQRELYIRLSTEGKTTVFKYTPKQVHMAGVIHRIPRVFAFK